MDPIALLFVFGVGFAAGYGVREWKSRNRRRRYGSLIETARGEVSGGAVHHPERDKVTREAA